MSQERLRKGGAGTPVSSSSSSIVLLRRGAMYIARRGGTTIKSLFRLQVVALRFNPTTPGKETPSWREEKSTGREWRRGEKGRWLPLRPLLVSEGSSPRRGRTLCLRSGFEFWLTGRSRLNSRSSFPLENSGGRGERDLLAFPGTRSPFDLDTVTWQVVTCLPSFSIRVRGEYCASWESWRNRENLNDHGTKNRVKIIGDCSKIPVGTAIIIIVAEAK